MSYTLRAYRSPERAQDAADWFAEHGLIGVRVEMNWEGWIIVLTDPVTHKKKYLSDFGDFITSEDIKGPRKI